MLRPQQWGLLGVRTACAIPLSHTVACFCFGVVSPPPCLAPETAEYRGLAASAATGRENAGNLGSSAQLMPEVS